MRSVAFCSGRIGTKDVLVDETRFVRFASTHSPEPLLERSYGAAEIHDRGAARPCNAGQVQPYQRRIPLNDKRADGNESRIRYVQDSHDDREKPVNHFPSDS